MRRAAALLAVALVALPLAGCGGGKDGDTYVLEVQGAADVTTPAAQHLDVGRHRLKVGQTVTVTRGRAVLGLPGDASLELRRGSTVQVGPRPTVVDGDALAVAGSGDHLAVSSGGATFDLHDGAGRVRRSAGVTFAVYEGRADVSSLGNRVSTLALHQVTVTDGGSLQMAVPLVYDRADPDPWDTRYLNDAIDLGGQLDRRVRLLNTRPAPPTLDAGYLEGIVPALRSAKGFRADLVDDQRSVGETVVGASIALGGSGDLVARWKRAFRFREEGADWGLVALDQRARRAAVLRVLDGVLDRVVASISPISVGRAGGRPTTSTAGRSATTTTTEAPRRGTTPTVPTAPATPILPPITVPILPSSPTPTTPPPTTPTRPSSPPSSPKPTIPPVTLPPPVQGLLDGLLGSGDGKGDGNGKGHGSGSDSGLGGLLDAVGHMLDGD